MRLSGSRIASGICGLTLAAVFLAATAPPACAQSTAQHSPQAPAVAPAGATVGAKEISLTVDVAQSSVHWTLDSSLHTVHGTFALKRGSLRIDTATGKASGELVADATSGKSGNDSRDSKMHKEVLESAKYSEVVFRPDRIDPQGGKIVVQGPWTASVHGIFVLHGTEHELTVPAQGEFTGDHWKGTVKFSVPFIEWGLKNPSNFLLKVNPAVDVELDLSGTMQAPAK